MESPITRNDASTNTRSALPAWQSFVRLLMVALFVAVAGVGLLDNHLTLAGTGSGSPSQATLLAAQATAETTSTTDIANLSIADVAAMANPAVVTVYNEQVVQQTDSAGGFQFPGAQNQPNAQQQDQTPQPVASGSGWIYDSDGHVITNNHVVEGAQTLSVQFYDGTTAKATLVGTDTVQDVAVLKIELADGQTLPGVSKVGDSSLMRPGDPVVAIGSPLGEYTNTVSEGIVGGLNRTLSSQTSGELDNLIQHDAPISSGNSGGPLLNMQGEVIGMNVATIDTSGSQQVTASGLNFAIDGNTVKKIADEIISTGKSVAYPYLGIQTQQTADGAGVVSVVAGSPADQGGVKEGDLITAIDGTSIDATHSLSQVLYQHRPGDKVELTVTRDGSSQTLTVTLGTRPDQLA
jgi:2-alkenal reductase